MQLLKKKYLRLKNRSRRALSPFRSRRSPALIQEEAGLHVGISAELADTARHAAGLMADKYQHWLERERLAAWGRYKRRHFTVAVGSMRRRTTKTCFSTDDNSSLRRRQASTARMTVCGIFASVCTRHQSREP